MEPCFYCRWEDVQGYRDVIGGQVPCIRRRNKETCLCSDRECNGACSFTNPALLITFAASLLAMLQALWLLPTSRFIEKCEKFCKIKIELKHFEANVLCTDIHVKPCYPPIVTFFDPKDIYYFFLLSCFIFLHFECT